MVKTIKQTLKDGTIKEYQYDKVYEKATPPEITCICNKKLKTKYSMIKHLKTKTHYTHLLNELLIMNISNDYVLNENDLKNIDKSKYTTLNVPKDKKLIKKYYTRKTSKTHLNISILKNKKYAKLLRN
jgi:hypothetical protein